MGFSVELKQLVEKHDVTITMWKSPSVPASRAQPVSKAMKGMIARPYSTRFKLLKDEDL